MALRGGKHLAMKGRMGRWCCAMGNSDLQKVKKSDAAGRFFTRCALRVHNVPKL